MMFVRVLYCIFLGLLVALFVGWAMSAWFPTPRWETVYRDFEQNMGEPAAPSPDELNLITADQRTARIQQYETDRAAYVEWQTNHDARDEEFKKISDKQGVTVALISMLIAVVVTSVSLLYSGKLQVITEGLLLGGIFTLIYSIGWTLFRAPTVAVLIVGVSLVVTIVIGYIKFVKKAADAKPADVSPPSV